MNVFRTAYVYVRNNFAGFLCETDEGYTFLYDLREPVLIWRNFSFAWCFHFLWEILTCILRISR